MQVQLPGLSYIVPGAMASQESFHGRELPEVKITVAISPFPSYTIYARGAILAHSTQGFLHTRANPQITSDTGFKAGEIALSSRFKDLAQCVFKYYDCFYPFPARFIAIHILK